MVRACSNLNGTFTTKLTSHWVVVISRRAVSHRELAAFRQRVIIPGTFNRLDIAIFEGHNASAVQLVILDHPFVLNAIIPYDFVLSFHRLILECASVDCWALLVGADIPLAVLECSFEPAIVSGVVVCDLAFGHITLIKFADIGSLVVGELESTLSMALIHSIDRTVIARSIAIGHLLLLQGCLLFSCSFCHNTTFFCLFKINYYMYPKP